MSLSFDIQKECISKLLNGVKWCFYKDENESLNSKMNELFLYYQLPLLLKIYHHVKILPDLLRTYSMNIIIFPYVKNI